MPPLPTMDTPHMSSGLANYHPSPTCMKLVAVPLPFTCLLCQRSMLTLAPVFLLVIPCILKPTDFGTPLLVFLIPFTFLSQNTLMLLFLHFILVLFLALQLPLAPLHGMSLGLLHQIHLNQINGHHFMTIITLLLSLTLLTVLLLQ